MADEIQDIEVERIFLYEENPRHEPLETQEAVIAQLCQDEQVYELAASICQEGTNPLELVGLVEKDGSGKRGSKKNYEVWEGNRRICAIKLLNDPELAPAKLRPRLEKLAEGYTPIRKVKGVVFANHKRLKFWMENIHGGEQGGVGRKRWNAVAKARSTGATKNALALALLERAEDYGFTTRDQWKGKLTTLTRYVDKAPMKAALGLDTTDSATIKTDLTDEDFKASLKTLIDDLLAGNLSSRANAPEIKPYARELPDRSGATTKRVPARPVATVGPKPSRKATPTPSAKRKKMSSPTKIRPSEELQAALTKRASYKIQQLYSDICNVSAVDHTLLVAVGVWSFIESVARHAEPDADTKFISFYSKQRLDMYGIKGSKAKGSVLDALSRLSRGGNDTKHHHAAGSFNASQIIADMEVVTPLLIATLTAEKE